MIGSGRTGLIRCGEMQGLFIRVLCDPDETGGYFVLYSRDFNDAGAEGYDEWYPEASDVERLLSQLVIEWESESK